MAESSSSKPKDVNVFMTLVTECIDTNAMLSALIPAVGELLAQSRGVEPKEQITRMWETVNTERLRLLTSITGVVTPEPTDDGAPVPTES